LKLKKNNWSCESYKFDEVFSENASQKRVYEVVAKPVVEASHAFLVPVIYYFISTFNIEPIKRNFALLTLQCLSHYSASLW